MTYAAQRWLYETDPVAYFLAQAVAIAKPKQKQAIWDTMRNEQKELTKKAAAGTWKRG